MEDKILKLKKEANELMQIKGNTKGSELLTLKKYIEMKYGKEGIDRLEQVMAEIGYPIKLNNIKPNYWYPEALNDLAMIVAKEIFNWKDLYFIVLLKDYKFHPDVRRYFEDILLRAKKLPLKRRNAIFEAIHTMNSL